MRKLYLLLEVVFLKQFISMCVNLYRWREKLCRFRAKSTSRTAREIVVSTELIESLDCLAFH